MSGLGCVGCSRLEHPNVDRDLGVDCNSPNISYNQVRVLY